MDFRKNSTDIEDMKYIIKDIENYTLKHEYDILASLRKDDESIIFHRCDTKLSELTVEEYQSEKEEFFEYFCDDILALDKKESAKIKQEVLKIILHSKKTYKDNIISDKYYEKLKEIKFDILETSIIEKIKEVILKVAFNSPTAFKREFVHDRIIYTNDYYLDEEWLEKTDYTNIWYSPKTEEEVIYAMEKEVHYAEIIINICDKFDKFAYSFAKVETADNFDLHIFTQEKQKIDTRTISIMEKYKMQLIQIDKMDYPEDGYPKGLK